MNVFVKMMLSGTSRKSVCCPIVICIPLQVWVRLAPFIPGTCVSSPDVCVFVGVSVIGITKVDPVPFVVVIGGSTTLRRGRARTVRHDMI